MNLRILIAVALIACAQAFEVKRLPLIKRPEQESHELTSEQQRELVDPYPTDYRPQLGTKEAKLGNIIEETEPESEGRMRRSPKEPATGKIVVSGNARKGSSTGGRTEGQIYVGGQIRFRRSAEEAPEAVEEVVEDETEEQTRVRRSPKKGRGRVIVRGEAGQTRGGKADAAVHLIGEYRFRRSAEEAPEAVEEVVENETEEQTRVRRSPKKGRGRLIIRGEGGQSTGRRADFGAHLIGEYRWRRSVEEQPEPIVEETQQESESRVRRSPKEPVTGKIVVSGNARKGSSTGGKTEGQIYVGGQVRFRRSAEEAPEAVEEVIEDETEEQTRVRRSPKKGRGRVIVRGEAGQTRGGKADAAVHLIGEYRFRRSAEEAPEAVQEVVEDETEEQTRVRRSPKKGRGRLIIRGEGGQSTGRRADFGAHLIGEYRWRRAAEEQPEPIVEQTQQEPEGRVRRSPKEPATGKIVVSGNARKGASTGGRTEGQVYVGGQIRFRRSAEEAPEAVEEVVEDETEEQTRVRRSPKKGRGRLIIRGEGGQSTGRRADFGAHLIGEYRWRRSVEEQPEPIVEETQQESEGRVRRSPKEPVTGKIVVSGNARKGSSTGGRTEGQVYVGGQIRFRRSVEEAPKDLKELVHHDAEEQMQTRFRRSPKKGRGRLIIRGEGGQSTGRRADFGAHLIGEYRWRRSAEQELAHH